jgi:hypothetical protein
VIAILATSLTRNADREICLARSDRFGPIWSHFEMNHAGDRSLLARAWRTGPPKVVIENGHPEIRMAASGVTVTPTVACVVLDGTGAADSRPPWPLMNYEGLR